MHSLAVILWALMLCVLILGGSCHLFPQVGLGKASNLGALKVYKRQNEFLNQCALDRFDAFYQGNTSRFVAECRSTMDSGFDLSSANQSTINTVYGTLCKPECGNVLLDSYESCGGFNEQRNIIVGLCAFNRNGNFCYEIHLESTVLYAGALSCFSSPDECSCHELSEGVRQQDCCINVIHDAVNSIGSLDPVEQAYDSCNVALPEMRCTNSTLRGSSPPVESDSFLELQQCVLDTFDSIYQGNNADFVTECRSLFEGGDEVAFTDQHAINALYGTFCIPECGKVFLGAYDACGGFDSQEQRDASASFCGSNEMGKMCYEILVDNIALLNSTLSCSSDPGECDCLELLDGVRRQGCCIIALRDYVHSLGGSVDLDVYSNCDIDIPGTKCQNNLISVSDPLPDEDYFECVLNEFDALYQGNHADFVAECRSIIDSGSGIPITNQSAAKAFYRTLCTPECGTVLLDAYSACDMGVRHEIFDAVFGFCATNENGDLCYEIFLDNITLIYSAVSCSTEECDCRELSQDVGTLGCCISVVHDFVNILDDKSDNIDLEKIYEDCNVDIQETCENNFLKGSGYLPQVSVGGVLWILLVQTVV